MRIRDAVRNEQEFDKEVINGKIDDVIYSLTVVNHHEDGKTIIYRRHRELGKRRFSYFNPSVLEVDDRTYLALGLLLQGWTLDQVALFLNKPKSELPNAPKLNED